MPRIAWKASGLRSCRITVETSRHGPDADATAVHLLAAAVWTGGLLLLGTERGSSAYDKSARRVSRVAFLSVVALAATGALQTWLLLGAVPTPWGSTYERLLLAKITGFAALVTFGGAGGPGARAQTVQARLTGGELSGPAGLG